MNDETEEKDKKIKAVIRKEKTDEASSDEYAAGSILETEKYNNKIAQESEDIFNVIDKLKRQVASLEEQVTKFESYKTEIEKKVSLSRIDQLLIISFYTAVIGGIAVFAQTVYNIVNMKSSSMDILVYSIIGFLTIIFLVFMFLFSLHNLFNMNNEVGQDCSFYIKNADRENGYKKIHCQLAKEHNSFNLGKDKEDEEYSYDDLSQYKTCKRCKNYRIFGVLLSFVVPIIIVFLIIVNLVHII